MSPLSVILYKARLYFAEHISCRSGHRPIPNHAGTGSYCDRCPMVKSDYKDGWFIPTP